MSSFAVISSAPGRLLWAWGPFHSAPSRVKDRLAFYVNDFALSDPCPWKHPAEWEELNSDQLPARLAHLGSDSIKVDFEPLWSRDFYHGFKKVKESLDSGRGRKIVAFILEHGRLQGHLGNAPLTMIRAAQANLQQNASRFWLYAFVDDDKGFVGMSPEILFSRPSAQQSYRTMAMAGTCAPLSVSHDEGFLSNPKESMEHNLVAEDIENALIGYGALTKEPTVVVKLPHLWHLKTEFSFSTAHENFDYRQIVSALHPTPALGVSPRTPYLQKVLRDLDPLSERKFFGAPFGYEKPNGENLAIVAIRNLQFNGSEILLGAGCGVVGESTFESEWQELAQKRSATKRSLGL